MPSRLKFSIYSATDVYTRRQTCGVCARRSAVVRRPPVQPLVHAVHGAAHTVSRKCVHIVGLGLFEKFGHIRRRHRVAIQARFESFETKGCQHQQPRNEGYEQPRHNAEVNTAKVSAGLRNATGTQ
jgi:hypothetical protein